MIATQEEQARVYNAVEAILKAQTGAYRAAQLGQESQATPADSRTISSTQDTV